jgi:hypothetical protein
MAELFGQDRHRTHESAADTQNMNVHSRPRKTWPQVSLGRGKSHLVFELTHAASLYTIASSENIWHQNALFQAGFTLIMPLIP